MKSLPGPVLTGSGGFKETIHSRQPSGRPGAGGVLPPAIFSLINTRIFARTPYVATIPVPGQHASRHRQLKYISRQFL